MPATTGREFADPFDRFRGDLARPAELDALRPLDGKRVLGAELLRASAAGREAAFEELRDPAR
jgi:hypothetical protein